MPRLTNPSSDFVSYIRDSESLIRVSYLYKYKNLVIDLLPFFPFLPVYSLSFLFHTESLHSSIPALCSQADQDRWLAILPFRATTIGHYFLHFLIFPYYYCIDIES